METTLSLHQSRPLLRLLRRAFQVHQSRRGLGRLDDHILRDIGLTRAEALTEASRPVWDAPEHWLQR